MLKNERDTICCTATEMLRFCATEMDYIQESCTLQLESSNPWSNCRYEEMQRFPLRVTRV